MKTVAALLLMCCCIRAQAQNTVKIEGGSAPTGEEVTVSVALDNTDDVAALQLSIPVSAGMTYVEGSCEMTERAADHSISAGVKDGMLNIMLYSLNMTALKGNSGQVLTLRMKTGREPLTMSLQPGALILTDTAGEKLEATVTAGDVTTLTPKIDYGTALVDYGRVPIKSIYTKAYTIKNVGNADLVITGLTFSAPEMTATNALPMTVAPGATAQIDMVYAPVVRGEVEETMTVVSNNNTWKNNVKIKALPFAVNELYVGSAEGVSDTEVTVALRMKNMDGISGFHIEIPLPEQLKYVDGSFALTERKADHAVVANVRNDTLRAVCYSLADNTFSGEDGDIATFRLLLDGRYSADIAASKAVLTAMIDGKDIDVLSDKYGGRVTIKSPRLSCQTSLDMGATPITEKACYNLTLRNYGSAPLVINKVVFDTLHFVTDKALPLVIEAGKSQVMAVEYDGMAETAYEAIMQIYSNDPDMRMQNVNIKGSRFAPNFISAKAEDIYKGDSLKVEVALDNYDGVSGIQFDVEYPADYIINGGDYAIEERAQGLTVTWRVIDENTVRYFCYSLADVTIAPGEGNVITLMMTTAQDVADGNYSLKIKNIKLGTPGLADKYAGTDIVCAFNVKTLILGDANGDGVVNIKDIVCMGGEIMGNEPMPFVRRQADVNMDDMINVKDVVGIADIIMGN